MVGHDRRGDMVPAAAIFIVSNDDDGAVGVETVGLNRASQVRDVLLAAREICVAGMFVIGTKRLDEANRRESAVRQVVEERLFVLQVRGGASGRGIQRAVRIEWRVLGIISEGLMMELKERIRISIDGVAPATRIPSPAH